MAGQGDYPFKSVWVASRGKGKGNTSLFYQTLNNPSNGDPSVTARIFRSWFFGVSVLEKTQSATARIRKNIVELREDFSAATIDSAKWVSYNSSPNTISQASGRLVITTGTTAAYSGYASQNLYDLTGSSTTVQLVNAGNRALASLEVAPLQLIFDTNNSIGILIANGNIYARKKVAGVGSSVATATYSSANHKYLRISESGGTITYATSNRPSGTWTTLGTTTVPFSIQSLQYEASAGTYANEASGTSVTIDNISTVGERYWVGGTGDWDITSTDHWSYTSGGPSGALIPKEYNTVIFDANSFSAGGQTVTFTDDAYAYDVDMTAVTNSPSIVMGAYQLIINGRSIAFSGSMSITGSDSSLRLESQIDTGGILTVTSNGLTLPGILVAYAYTRGISLLDALTVYSIYIDYGAPSFNTNNHTITSSAIAIDAYTAATFGTSTVNIAGAAFSNNFVDLDFDLNGNTGVNNLSAASATFNFDGTTTSSAWGQVKLNSVQTIGTLNLSGGMTVGLTGGGELDLDGTITNLNFAASARYEVIVGKSLTVTNIAFNGTSGNEVVLRRKGASGTYTINKTSGSVTGNYLDIANSTVGGGALWQRGTGFIDSGSNVGWVSILTNTQTAVARIANTFTSAQTSVARVSNVDTLAQTAIARLSGTLTRTQTATANIQSISILTNAQTATARIQRILTRTQASISRISNSLTHAQTAVARVSRTYTRTQPAVSRIQRNLSTTQTSVARVQQQKTNTQSVLARIARALTNAQTSVARVAHVIARTQPATATLTQSVTTTQTATARIALSVTALQTSTASIVVIGAANQTATARIGVLYPQVPSGTGDEKYDITETPGGTITAGAPVGGDRVYTPETIPTGDYTTQTTDQSNIYGTE